MPRALLIQGLLITGIGLGVGILMASIMYLPSRWLDSFPELERVHGIIHLPAYWCFVYLMGLHDEDMNFLPWLIVAQWVLIGLGVALWWCRKGW